VGLNEGLLVGGDVLLDGNGLIAGRGAIAAQGGAQLFEVQIQTAGDQWQIGIDVTVLCPLEAIDGPESLDPKRYGVVVSDAKGRRGVLLPDLEGIDDVETQLSIAKRKAGISKNAPVSLQRFEALRFNE